MQKFLEMVQRFGHWCARHKVITVVAVVALLLIVPLHYSYATEPESLFTKFLANPLDATMITLAGIIQVVTSAIGRFILLLIQVIVIPILGYNGFYNSHIVNLGWSLVRDVVNMGVVVVLLVIAIMTLVGYSKASWTTQLPQLFLAVIMVNFSKLICGVLIDMSQVVMFTFVNAIVSIAAGNFASMLSINTFGQFAGDFLDKQNAAGDGVQAFEFLMGSYLQFIVLLGILGVMFLLAVAFVWRIVMLWILIIMSPLAFFSFGVGDLFHMAHEIWGDWKKKFFGALTFGPIMVFFLWLALAASSGSNLAQTEDFPMPDSKSDAGLPLAMFSLDNFLGMFLALAIIIAGMQQASAAAGALGGFAGKMLSAETGTGLLKGLARPFDSSKRLAKAGVEKGSEYSSKLLPYTTSSLVGGAGRLTSKAGILASRAGLGVVGNSMSAAGGFMVGQEKKVRSEIKKGGDARVKDFTEDQEKLMLGGMADAATNNPHAPAGRNLYKSLTAAEQASMDVSFVTNTKLQQKFKDQRKAFWEKSGKLPDGATTVAEAVEQDFSKTLGDKLGWITSDSGKIAAGLDDAQKETVEAVYAANPHLIEPKGLKSSDAGYSEAKRAEIRKRLDKAKIEGKLRPGAFSVAAFKDADFMAVAAGMKMRQDTNNKDVMLLDDLKAGRNGATVAQMEALRPVVTSTSIAGHPETVQALVSDGRLRNMERTNPVAQSVATFLPGMTGSLDPAIHGAATGMLLDKGFGVDELIPNFPGDLAAAEAFVDTTPANQEVLQRVDGMMMADATNAVYLDSVVPATVTRYQDSNHFTAAIADGVNTHDIQELQKAARDPNATTEVRTRSQRALSVIQRSVDAERLHAVESGNRNRAQNMERLQNQVGMSRYTDRPSRRTRDAEAIVAAGAVAAAATAEAQTRAVAQAQAEQDAWSAANDNDVDYDPSAAPIVDDPADAGSVSLRDSDGAGDGGRTRTFRTPGPSTDNDDGSSGGGGTGGGAGGAPTPTGPIPVSGGRTRPFAGGAAPAGGAGGGTAPGGAPGPDVDAFGSRANRVNQKINRDANIRGGRYGFASASKGNFSGTGKPVSPIPPKTPGSGTP